MTDTKLRINANGQWTLEKAYKPGSDLTPNRVWESEHRPSAYDHERVLSTTKGKTKDGKTMYHHILTPKSKSNFIRHIISANEDPNKEGIAVGTGFLQEEGTNIPTAEGNHSIKTPALLLNGIYVNPEHQKAGYGTQLFHNMAHYHGALIGDKAYSGSGEALMNRMSQHSAYEHIADTSQHKDTPDDLHTRSVYYLKDKSKIGKIPIKV